ncbi:MAG TPA: hypothetical protein VLM89_16290 [Phycisphaerae bacterium]|nr:hypothetical protein [Phycisphaerae bacterium]
MKAIITLIALLAVVLAVVYFRGGYQSFDPAEQGNKAKAAIKPGMTWKQVIDAAGTGGKYRSIMKKVERTGGQEYTTTVLGPHVELKPDRVAAHVAAGDIPDGFIFEYRFSQSVAFAVIFDGAGIVDEVRDLTTMADLLGTK